MAADLHIHILEGATEDDLRATKYSSIGSKYCALTKLQDGMPAAEIEAIFAESDAQFARYEGDKSFDEIYGEGSPYWRIEHTPNIRIGQVSWLKAALTGDVDTYVPNPVMHVHKIIGEDLPVIDDVLIQKIAQALEMDNHVSCYDVAAAKEVVEFLNAHRGKHAFTISW